MTRTRTPYSEASSPSEMSSDCEAVGKAMPLPRQAGASTDDVAAEPSPVVVSDAVAAFAGSFVD